MKAETLETDVLIIGGGAAGCSAALTAHKLGARVHMVVKGKMGRSGATPLASGIAAGPSLRIPYWVIKAAKKVYKFLANYFLVPIPVEVEKNLRGVLDSHYGLVDQDYFVDFSAWVVSRFFPRLERNAFYVLRHDNGEIVHPTGGGFTFVSHSHGMTGYQFGEARRKEVIAAGIPVMEEAMAFELLKNEQGEVAGAMVLDYKTGKLYAIKAGATILATGHTNWLAKRTTGTREMAANGLAMAVRAGATLENVEIQWFHAADLAEPASWMRLHHYPNPLHGSAHRGVMKNAAGETYMRIEEYNTRVPYPIQMKKLYQQIKAGKASWDKGSFNNFIPVERDALKNYQYHWEFYEKIGKDMATDDLECGITWHMSAGGVSVDTDTMATTVPRLYIAGAVGGHMLGGLPFATYDGEVAGASAAARAKEGGGPALAGNQQIAKAEQRLTSLLASAAAKGNAPTLSPIQIKTRIREIVWDNMMYARTDQGLQRGLQELAAVRGELAKLKLRSASARFNTDLVDALDIEDMIDVCEMVAHAARERTESRGPHFREDFPYTDNDNWLKKIVVWREGQMVKTRTVPVKQKYVRYKSGRRDFFEDPYA